MFCFKRPNVATEISSYELLPLSADHVPKDGEAFITLVVKGIHAFLIIQTVHEKHRIVRKADFNPERDVDSVMGKGRITVKTLEPDSAKFKKLFNEHVEENKKTPKCFTFEKSKKQEKFKCFPTWKNIAAADVERMLQSEIDSQAETPIYSSNGDSSNSSSPDKVQIHNCWSWCEQALNKVHIIVPGKDEFRPMKLPQKLIWNFKK